MNLSRPIAALLLYLVSWGTAFGVDTVEPSPAPKRKYVHLTRTDISRAEKGLTFGAVYIAQWASYFIDQPETIRKKGSFKNWYDYMFEPHFDRDSFHFNVIGHTTSGSMYYLFYRSRGYSVKESFLWSFTSSLAFEFTIETVTERPSFQDMYQTPVFGTVAGMALERVSNFFHTWDNWPGHLLGYIFNPMGLLPMSEYGFQTTPIINQGSYGGAVSLRF